MKKKIVARIESQIFLIVSSSSRNLLSINGIQNLRFFNVIGEENLVQLNLSTMFKVVALNFMCLAGNFSA